MSKAKYTPPMSAGIPNLVWRSLITNAAENEKGPINKTSEYAAAQQPTKIPSSFSAVCIVRYQAIRSLAHSVCNWPG